MHDVRTGQSYMSARLTACLPTVTCMCVYTHMEIRLRTHAVCASAGVGPEVK